MSESAIYYHFVSASKRLRFDMSDIEVLVGLTLTFDGNPVLCEQGLHASARALDALKFAPSDAEWLCGVRLSGTVVHGEDKSVATERTVVWMLNVRKLLVEFALWNVEQAFDAIREIGFEPDPRSIEAVRVVRLWLVDQASDEELSAAARAARAAYVAADAADAATYAAARAAARAADAAFAAARAAYVATYAAAYAAYAADAAAYVTQNEQFESMILAALAQQDGEV